MIVTSQVHHCRECGSAHIVRSGRNRYGSQQYQCRDCGASKAEVLCARQERSSLRGLSRTFGITRKTITRWLKKLLSLPAVEETLSVARASDVIEFDEACSFVRRRKNKRWLWTVMCRTGPARSWPSPTATIARVPAGHFGSRWPETYRKCRSFSGFWKTYVGSSRREPPQRRQGDQGDHAHGALVQHPAPAHRVLRPQDPLLLQEGLVARSSAPLVHHRIQPVMFLVATITLSFNSTPLPVFLM